VTEYQKRWTVFSGNVYHGQASATSDAARRFETDTKRLRYAFIKVTTQDQNFGSSATQLMTVTAPGSFEILNVDLSQLYFRNTNAGQDGIVIILGTEE
jgi:hypothetical protein